MVRRDNTMMRWVEWWNAMKKGDRETAQLLLVHYFAIGHCTPSPKVIGRLDDPDVPEAASAFLQPYSRRGFTCQKN